MKGTEGTSLRSDIWPFISFPFFAWPWTPTQVLKYLRFHIQFNPVTAGETDICFFLFSNGRNQSFLISNMYKPLAVIISSPLTLIYQVEMTLGIIINTILIYIIYKHTPPKMKNYKLILLNMTVSLNLLVWLRDLRGCRNLVTAFRLLFHFRN